MAVSLGDIVTRFLADTSELVAGVEESKGLLGGMGGIAAGVGVAAGAALVGIGVESVKMAGDFQQSLTQLVTGARESQSNLGMVGEGIKRISVESAMSTKQLTEGMYMIESAGFHGSAGLDVLKASAEGARAGNASLATAAKAVTTLMVDYSAKHYTATEAMNALIATEGAGQAHLEDLGRSMGAVLPLASALGVSFPQVAAGIAVMTNAGMTAQHASQNLANALRNLAAPSGKAADMLDYIGLSAQKVKDTLGTQGLGAALQVIEEHVGKKFPAGSSAAVAAFKTIMGGATGYNVALMLGGDHMKDYEANVKSIGSALSKNASDVEGFSLVQQNFSFQLDKAKMAGEALMLTLGQALLPVLTPLLAAITPIIGSITQWVAGLSGLSGGIDGITGHLAIFSPLVDHLRNIFLILSVAAKTVGQAFADNFAPYIGPISHELVMLLSAIMGLVNDGFDHLQNAVAQLMNQPLFTWGEKIGTLFGSGLLAALTGLTNGLLMVDAAMNSLVDFLTAATLPSEIFRDLLVGIGVAMAVIKAIGIAQAIISFIEVLPMVIGLTSMWAAGMAAVALETIIAMAPYIAIAAVVAIVVAGILLAINHWGEITKWLQGVWAGFSSWFMGALGAIGVFFGGVWAGITKFFQETLTVLVAIGKIGFQVLYYAAFGPILAIGAAFQWLYNHNYYFKDLIDAIVNWTKAGLSWLQGAWQATANWLGARWGDISRTSASVWDGISKEQQRQAAIEGSAIHSAWTATATFTTTVWNAIATSVSSAWRSISAIIGGAWNTYIAGPLGGLWNRFTGWFGNLAGMAIQWGANLISSFGKGIVSSLGSLGNSLGQAAGTVTKFLGFHSPTELGPGRDADKWAPNLIKMYAGGIAAGVPQIASASSSLVAPLAPRLSTPASGGASRSQTAHIHVYLGGKEIVSQLMPMVYDEARAMTGWRPVS